VSAQLILCRVVSMPASVRGCGAWLRAGGVGGGPGGLPLLGVCSQDTSTPCTWSMVAVAFAWRKYNAAGTVRWQQQEAGARAGDISRCCQCS